MKILNLAACSTVTVMSLPGGRIILLLMSSGSSLRCNSVLEISTVSNNTMIELVKWLELSVLLEQNIALEEPWKPCPDLVRHESSCRDGKDVVKLLQGALL